MLIFLISIAAAATALDVDFRRVPKARRVTTGIHSPGLSSSSRDCNRSYLKTLHCTIQNMLLALNDMLTRLQTFK
jgi:hypothetical protein